MTRADFYVFYDTRWQSQALQRGFSLKIGRPYFSRVIYASLLIKDDSPRGILSTVGVREEAKKWGRTHFLLRSTLDDRTRLANICD